MDGFQHLDDQEGPRQRKQHFTEILLTSRDASLNQPGPSNGLSDREFYSAFAIAAISSSQRGLD